MTKINKYNYVFLMQRIDKLKARAAALSDPDEKKIVTERIARLKKRADQEKRKIIIGLSEIKSEKCSEAARMAFLHGKTPAEIATALNIKGMGVYRYLKNACEIIDGAADPGEDNREQNKKEDFIK